MLNLWNLGTWCNCGDGGGEIDNVYEDEEGGWMAGWLAAKQQTHRVLGFVTANGQTQQQHKYSLTFYGAKFKRT